MKKTKTSHTHRVTWIDCDKSHHATTGNLASMESLYELLRTHPYVGECTISRIVSDRK